MPQVRKRVMKRSSQALRPRTITLQQVVSHARRRLRAHSRQGTHGFDQRGQRAGRFAIH
jgi:hypothetical protein